MKIFFYSLFIVCFLQIDGQVTITNTIFYKAGDTIVQNIDNDGAPAIITPDSSGAYSWDFSGLQKQGVNRDSIRKVPANDTNKLIFPTATIIMPFQNFGNEYVEVTSTEVRGLGLNFSFFGINQSQPYTKGKRIIQFAPITYNIKKNSSSSVGLVISTKAIPFLDSLLKQVNPVPGSNIDSIRLSIVTDVSFHADAFGKLKTPYQTLDVLRVQQDNKTSTKIEGKVKLGIFPAFWLDISSFIPLPLPKDTQTQYNFYSDKAKDPIVVVNVNKAGKPTRALFRAYAVPVDTTKPKDTTSPKDTTKPKDSFNVSIKPFHSIDESFHIHTDQKAMHINVPEIFVGEAIQIIDESGKIIHSEKIQTSQFSISYSYKNSAILFIRISNLNQTLTKKVLIGYTE